MGLPQKFESRMQDMLKEAYPAFLRSYDMEKYQSLRINPLKGEKDTFMTLVPFFEEKDSVEQVPWEQNGIYYSADMQPGKHPFHEAGVYYIQEPSAMAPAAYLKAEPGERILDLCAAPGGKTTQIASYMQGEGLLVCNEIHPQRAKILSENVERMGIKNALVTNETPQKLAEVFDCFFDRVLVDAPCSGEGMFRKNEDAQVEWSPENVQLCADRQDEILDCADSMLKPGGRLVYSTCTFAPAENEGSIARFLQRHPAYEIEEVPLVGGMEHGVPQWGDGNPLLSRTIRLWPHKCKGEGHFLAVLHKKGEAGDSYEGFSKYGFEYGAFPKKEGNGKEKKGKEKGKSPKTDVVKSVLDFQEENLNIDLFSLKNQGLLAFGDQIYLLPEGMPSLHGLKVLRPGLHLGTLKKERFEPSHALALFLKPQQAKRVMNLSAKEPQAAAFIQGQTLNYEGEKGWYLVTVDGYSLGWGKLAGQVMKNHYPKGLRKG